MTADRSILATGIPQLLLLGLVWGATFPIARVGVDAGANPFLLVALDLLLAAGVIGSVAIWTRTPWPNLRNAAQSAGLGALLIAGINLPLYWGLQGATGGAASIVYATSPIVSLVFLWGLGSSTGLRRRQLAALAIGLGGVVLLGVATSGGGAALALGALVAFGFGATCQGVGAVLVGRARPHGEDHGGLTLQFLGGALASLVLLPLLSTSPALPLTAATLGSIAYVGVISMALGYTLFFGVIQQFGAVRANQVTFLNPVVALIVGVIAFGEGFPPVEAVALALIVLALVLLQPSLRHRPTTHRTSDAGPTELPHAS
ncbi:MAG: DMT family transporter [Thermoplasmata archaeon]|nr:DMT family transporter [Thermoplasmata archaeon]